MPRCARAFLDAFMPLRNRFDAIICAAAARVEASRDYRATPLRCRAACLLLRLFSKTVRLLSLMRSAAPAPFDYFYHSPFIDAARVEFSAIRRLSPFRLSAPRATQPRLRARVFFMRGQLLPRAHAMPLFVATIFYAEQPCRHYFTH